jgi:hypothetical protein
VEGVSMRTFLFAAFALSALAAPACGATRNFGVSSFTKIRVDGPYKVTIATGVPVFARASGTAAAIDRVAVEVRGDTLVVGSNPSWGGFPGIDPGPVEVSVGTHDLTNASLIGAGSLAIDKVKGLTFVLSIQGSGAGEIADANADQLTVNLDGSANAKLSGRAGKLTVLARGLSTLNAAGLTTPNAAISADGTATVDTKVTETARIDAWGPATIRLSGQPSCTVKVTGSVTVSGCKSAQ